MDTAYDTIIVEPVGAVCRITLNRPEKRNAQNATMISELHAAMEQADRDRDVRAIVLLGAGSSFSAGHDMKGGDESGVFAEYDREQLAEQLRYAQEVLFGYWMFIHDLRTPTIAGVHGYVATAGISLTAMCDLVIAADDTQFFDHAVTLFALPGTELCWYPWELGVRKAKEFLWTQPVWDAPTMAQAGLINRVVPRAELESTVMSMAEQISLASPDAISLSKRILNETWDIMGKRRGFEFHLMAQQLANRTEDRLARAAQQQGRADRKEYLRDIRTETKVVDPRSVRRS
jgi:enoyl-CoA hydratase